MIHIAFRLLNAKNKCLTFEYSHLIYPIVYSVGLACYLGISHTFTLEPPDNSVSGSDVEIKLGTVALFGAEFLALASFSYYYITRKLILSKIGSLEKVPETVPEKNLKNDTEYDRV